MENRELYIALKNAKREFGPLYKKTKAYKGDYETLPQVFDLVEPVLDKHGLDLDQYMVIRNAVDILVTKVIHLETMQEKVSEFQMIVGELEQKDIKMQIEGGLQTYHRRFQIKLVLGLCGEKDDTDGYKPEHKPSGTVTHLAPNEPVAVQGSLPDMKNCVSEKQANLFRAKTARFPDFVKTVFKTYNISNASYIPWKEFSNILKAIDQLEAAANE